MLETTSRKTKTIDSINPASGEILARFAEHQPDDIDQALALAVKNGDQRTRYTRLSERLSANERRVYE